MHLTPEDRIRLKREWIAALEVRLEQLEARTKRQKIISKLDLLRLDLDRMLKAEEARQTGEG